MPKFLAQLDAHVLLNFLGHHQCDTHDMHNRFLMRRRPKFTHAHGGPRSQVPHFRPQAPSC